MAMVADGPNIFAGGYGGVSLSTDGGVTWTNRSSGLPGEEVSALAVCDSVVFAGTFGAGVFVSTDNGASWDTSNVGMPMTYLFEVGSIGSTVFAAGDDGVFFTTNSGASWNPTTASVPFAYLRSMAISGTDLFAGGSFGRVHVTEDGGAHWKDVGEGAPLVAIDALVSDGTDLFAGTWCHGVVRRPLSEMVTSLGELDPGALPRGYSLASYPNPFNARTTIRYALPRRSYLRLDVFNTLGQCVATLVQGEQGAGVHETAFDASACASGVYLYRLNTGDYVQTRKGVLVR
jgi:hypothetical protein